MALQNSWAEVPELLGEVFDFEGSASVMGEYDSWDFTFANIDGLKDRDTIGKEDDADIIYDVVHDYGDRHKPLTSPWWSEYLDSRDRHSALFFLVVSERPVALGLSSCEEGGEVSAYVNDSRYSERIVVVVDLSAADGREAKRSLLELARKAIVRLASERGLYLPAA